MGTRRRIGGGLSTLLLGALLLMPMAPAVAATLYRFTNERGNQEIGYTIPPHLVRNGYDVIDESGRLIRRVEPQLSEEEYAAKLERERKLVECQKALDRVRRRYETLADIDEAEAQFDAQHAESLKNTQANLDFSRAELSRQQEQAASLERAGKLIPPSLLQAIRTSELNIQNLTAQLEQAERARSEQARVFDEERKIFEQDNCDPERLAQAN